MNPIKRAAESAGSQAALALAIGVKQPTISEWARGERPIPADRCPDIECAANGDVTCEALRPDVRWHRVPDANWPHPEGRPLIDVATAATATDAELAGRD